MDGDRLLGLDLRQEVVDYDQFSVGINVAEAFAVDFMLLLFIAEQSEHSAYLSTFLTIPLYKLLLDGMSYQVDFTVYQPQMLSLPFSVDSTHK